MPQIQTYESYLTQSPEDSLTTLHTTTQGLTHQEAAARLLQHGPNLLKAHQVSWLAIFIRQFKSPYIYLLFGASLLALLLGEFIDGLMILLFVLINATLGFFQEFRSEQALKVLRKLTTSHANTVRDGQKALVPVDQLVPGDIIQLQPGDIIPADLRLLETQNLFVDESILTGESEPTQKSSARLRTSKIPLHQCQNIAFSSTSIVGGSGLGAIIATGSTSYLGTIAKLTVETHSVSSFETGMSKFSAFVLRLVGITLAIVFLANLLIKGSAADIGDLIIFSIALATAVIPEALPVVITFSLSRGAARLAKHKVVVKRLSAIEDLGGIEVLCTDKTGTITQNQLEVVDIFGDKPTVLTHANLAIPESSSHPDPFDSALKKALDHSLKKPRLISQIPFDPVRKRNSVLCDHDGKCLLIVRGAAESVLPYTHKPGRSGFNKWSSLQEAQGRRIIVIAHKNVSPNHPHDQKSEESNLVLSGAVAFTDPLKTSSAVAIKKAQALGVAIKIITGDSPTVAAAVAQEIGLIEASSQVITAQHLFSLPPSKQKRAAQDYRVFARFSPHQKHQLIDLLQTRFEVGFLGEGINDAPALKSANVGLVVQGASDIARESADVILLNSSLGVIIDGIQEGREVFANTIKYVKMTLASNFGNFFAVAVASLIIDYLPMLPIQILLVNLLSDFPLIAIATDSVDKVEIQTPESYNLRDFALVAVIIGLVSTVFDFIFFSLFYRQSPPILQTNWFMGSILTELALLYSLRTRLPFYKAKFPTLTILVLTLLAAAVTIVIPYLPVGQHFFQFTPPSSPELVIILSLVFLYFISTELVKLLYYRFASPPAATAA